MKSLKLSFLLMFLTIFTVGCANEELVRLGQGTRPAGYITVKAEVCTQDPESTPQKMKYLFIVDHSASNKPGFPLVEGDIRNVDPEGRRRYGPMADFIRNLEEDPNNATSFGLITFNDHARRTGSVNGFNSDAADFLDTVIETWVGDGTAANPSPIDGGFTNYESALNMARQMIQTDAERESAQPGTPIRSVYNIIFVSDGAPTVPQGSGTYTQQFTADLQPLIVDILNIKNNPQFSNLIANITLNTSYYYNDQASVEAIGLLEQMAELGEGQFLQFGNGRNILYQRFTPPQRAARNQLIDVFVDNLNAVWWEDGTFRSDSSGNGLPDFMELALGSDPLLYDTDGNGVSDFVEYRTRGRACTGENCNPLEAEPYAMCDGFHPSTDEQGRVTFPSSTNDGFNDCEKFLLGASRSHFSTNQNLVPDFYSVRQQLSYIEGTGGHLSADPFGDGMDNYRKLKMGLPVGLSQNELPVNVRTRSTRLTKISEEEDGECYQLEVKNVAVASFNDKIEVLLVQNSRVIEDKPILLKASRSADEDGQVVHFRSEDFR